MHNPSTFGIVISLLLAATPAPAADSGAPFAQIARPQPRVTFDRADNALRVFAGPTPQHLV